MGTYKNSHAQYDIAVDGVPFFLGPQADFPYMRTPKQVTKQQIDTTREAGEQSFTSWWYRSQSSFHYGAGERYFDVIRDEDGPNEYQFFDSAHVDVWSKGQVRLLRDMDKAYDGLGEVGDKKAAWGDLTGFAYKNLNGVLWQAGTDPNGDAKNNQLHFRLCDVNGVELASERIPWFDGEFPDPTEGSTRIHSICTHETKWFLICDKGVYAGELPYILDGDGGPDVGVAGTGRRLYRFPGQIDGEKWDGDRGIVRYIKDRLIVCEGDSVWEVSESDYEDLFEGDDPPFDDPTQPPRLDQTWDGDGYSRLLFRHPNEDWVWNGCAEGPDSIFVAGYAGTTNEIHGFFSQIYAFTLQAASLDEPPKLTHPFVTYTCPHGEYQLRIVDYVQTWLIVPTTMGVRVGKIGEQGSLRMGPLSIDNRQLFDTNSAGRWDGPLFYDAACMDQFAFVTGALIGDEQLRGCFRLDLTKPVDETGLKFAFAKDIATNHADSYVARIAPVGNTGLLAMMTRSGDVWVESSTRFRQSGWLHTSLIRFSTWEDKIFQWLRTVFSPNHAGTIKAEWFAELDGSSGIALPASPMENVVPPRYDREASDGLPHVGMSWKFTLDRTADVSPQFNGYQLKAGVSNVTQVEMRLPLLCYRRERLRSGRTVERSTWDRIKKLEELQRSQRVVTFQNFLTGEEKQVQVLSSSFIQQSPGQSAAEMADPGGMIELVLHDAKVD